MTIRKRLCVATIAVSAAAVVCCACSGGSSSVHQSTSETSPSTSSSGSASAPASDPPSSTQASTSKSPSTASIEAAAQAAWLNFWKIALALGTEPRSQWPARVASIAVEPSYSEILNSVRAQLLGQGEVGYGYIVSHPSWPNPPKTGATNLVMADCYDGSHAGSKVLKTGKTRTVGKPRTNVRVTMTLGADSKWRVKQTQYLAAAC